MKKLILSFLLLTIIGIIPAMLVVLISKYSILTILFGILALGITAKELCF